eukprot:TRINITY_DN2177_c0_g5_i1.p3 TRINITY_DN2177_c0_g5~~TRINITY_DN2177_c0_g5_i1.p3  ORF type:complete len:145 (+),score=62.49 TRINITY_DN2177_c0_g5_i1:69-503(+)
MATQRKFDPRAPISDAEGLKEVDWSDVAASTDDANAKFVIYGRVYALTSFLKVHPGGEDTLRFMAGQDASGDWDAVGHTSERTYNFMKDLVIGKVVGKKPRRVAKKAQKMTPMEGGQSFNVTMLVVAAFLCGAAYVLFGEALGL